MPPRKTAKRVESEAVDSAESVSPPKRKKTRAAAGDATENEAVAKPTRSTRNKKQVEGNVADHEVEEKPAKKSRKAPAKKVEEPEVDKDEEEVEVKPAKAAKGKSQSAAGAKKGQNKKGKTKATQEEEVQSSNSEKQQTEEPETEEKEVSENGDTDESAVVKKGKAKKKGKATPKPKPESAKAEEETKPEVENEQVVENGDEEMKDEKPAEPKKGKGRQTSKKGKAAAKSKTAKSEVAPENEEDNMVEPSAAEEETKSENDDAQKVVENGDEEVKDEKPVETKKGKGRQVGKKGKAAGKTKQAKAETASENDNVHVLRSGRVLKTKDKSIADHTGGMITSNISKEKVKSKKKKLFKQISNEIDLPVSEISEDEKKSVESMTEQIDKHKHDDTVHTMDILYKTVDYNANTTIEFEKIYKETITHNKNNMEVLMTKEICVRGLFSPPFNLKIKSEVDEETLDVYKTFDFLAAGASTNMKEENAEGETAAAEDAPTVAE